MAFISPYLWPFLRILAVFSSAPVFSSPAFPIPARIGFAFIMSVVAQAGLPEFPVFDLNSSQVLGVVIQQVGIGLAIGFTVRIFFAAFELAGELIGLQMGLGMAAFYDATSGSTVNAVSRFYANLASLLLIVLNGHLAILAAIHRSFETFPVTQNFLDALKLMKLYVLGGEIFTQALWMAAPVLGLLLFVNIVLGIISRIAPQLNIFSIGFPITLFVGLAGLLVSIPFVDQLVIRILEQLMVVFSG